MKIFNGAPDNCKWWGPQMGKWRLLTYRRAAGIGGQRIARHADEMGHLTAGKCHFDRVNCHFNGLN